MSRPFLLSSLLVAVAVRIPLAAQPSISNVQNAASNIPQGLPNAPIAQGSVFVVKGSGLGPSSSSVASQPFQSTTLSGTSVTVAVSGTTVNAPMYYTSATQVAALLPSNTPIGTGTVTVTYSGQPSAAAPVTVVANNGGILTLDSSGQGPAIVTYPDYTLVSAFKDTSCGPPSSPCGAANPGDTLSLWGTGLGPVNGSDVSGAGLGQNMPNLPLTVWVGGVQAAVVYKGRSGCCVGEDQVVFMVPANAPTGCAVPLLVQIGSTPSNTTTIPIANGSRNCTPTNPGLAAVSADLGLFSGPFTTSNLKLSHFSDGGGTYEDDSKFQFQKLSLNPGTLPFALSWFDDPPAGTCMIYNNLNQNQNLPIASDVEVDGGSAVTVTGPKGPLQLPTNTQLTAFNMTGAFLVPGSYTITGTGGAVIGPFTATIAMPPSPMLVSPVNNGTAARANGMAVTWTGGSGNLQLEVNAPTDNTNTNGAIALCFVPASAGTFTIPAYVLEALPASTVAGFVLSPYAEGTFTASGLNLGMVATYSNAAGFGYGWGSGGFTLK